MTSVMQRPRSTQPPADIHYNDDTGTHNRGASSHDYNSDVSPSGPTLGTSQLGEQLADLQRELLGQTSMAGASSAGGGIQPSQLAGPSDLRILDDQHGSVDNIALRNNIGSLGGLEGEGSSSTSMGLLDDPAVLALVGQSSHMESTDFELNLAAQALSSQVVEDAPGPFSDLDLTSAGTFQFPELPASLLDQAPEYEYVSD